MTLLKSNDEHAEESKDRRWDDPTPLEIRLACLRIQASWTDEERSRRERLRGQGWTLLT